jgi:hypothetical protein
MTKPITADQVAEIRERHKRDQWIYECPNCRAPLRDLDDDCDDMLAYIGQTRIEIRDTQYRNNCLQSDIRELEELRDRLKARIAELEAAIKDEIDKWPVLNTDHPLYKALNGGRDDEATDVATKKT